jgi:hypothetical protein
MRHDVPVGRFNPGNPFADGIADGRYHHGFHGGAVLFMLIGLLLIFVSWVFWKKIKRRKPGNNHFAFSTSPSEESSITFTALSSQRATILDQWEANILKEEHDNGHL